MASWLSYVYPLLLVALAGAAIYEHRSTAALSLPLPPALTILAILLPLFSLGLSYALSLSGPLRLRTARVASLIEGFQLLQVVLSAVLATSFFTAAAPTDVRACLLGTTWQHLFAAKDAAAIRRIQDTLECCGFNSVRDRAWPFQEDRNGGAGGAPCAERFGRQQACAGPWAASLQRNAGLDGGVAVAVAVLQVVISLLIRWAVARQQSAWPRLLAPFVGAGDRDEAVFRPLLRDSEGYAAGDDVDDGDDADVAEGAQDRHTPPTGGGPYGSAGPRVQPASYNADHGERNAWEAD